METTLIILKPDAVQRGLIGKIISKFEEKGLKIVGGKFMRVPEALAAEHYAEHKGKAFYDGLMKFITGSPVLVLAIRGPGAVAVCRKVIGVTNAAEAEPGSIRGQFGISKSLNLVHGSDSPTSAERELKLWFRPDELCDWDRADDGWIGF